MRVPGILIAAPASESGKTAAACALMQAYRKRGLTVRACKCGPDYIDPMFHREALGIDSRNLDLFFSGREELRQGYAEHISGADLAVTEGVMGYYDGMSLESDRASSYDVARTLGLPVILVIPCRGASLSLAALIKGMLGYRKDSRIRGILLNRVSGALYPRLKSMLERELQEMGYHIPVAGYLPEDEAFSMESRHLGLVTPQEMKDRKSRTARAGELLSRTVDLEKILRIAREEAFEGEDSGTARKAAPACPAGEEKVRIGIARDEAFCFYYQENLRLLESLGCSLVPFSPLSDAALPADLDGMILGGGYPELYARRLSENRGMRRSVRDAVRSGMPCLAECGGFMYLHEGMEDSQGTEYPMAGVLKGKTFPTGKLVRFGYVSISTASEHSAREGRLRTEGYLFPGEEIRGHEFHYWDSTDSGHACEAAKPDGRRRWACIHMAGNLFAGYPHLYLPSLPVFAERFVNRCRERKNGGSTEGENDESGRSITED